MSAQKKENFRVAALLMRHLAALGYVLRVVLPVILRTGRRPVIFSRFIGMGDIICTIPAARALMQRHPGAPFIYNCHRDFASVPRLAGLTDRVTTFESIGIVGHWYGFLLGGFYHFAHRGDTPGQIEQEPMVVEFCRQFQVTVTDQHPLFVPSSAAREKVRALLAQNELDPAALILLHPGPSWKVKEWPREHWTQLVADLRRRGHTHIAQLGVGHYLTTGKIAVETIPGAVSLVDQVSLGECAALLAGAKLFIGIDSGLLHLAAATRAPSIGLWGSTTPQFFYAPAFRAHFQVAPVPCRGCEHQKPRGHWFTGCPHHICCMQSLLPADVLPACLDVLEKTAASR